MSKRPERASEPQRRPPESFKRRLFSPQSIAAIVAELGKQGTEASSVLDGTELTESQLELHKTRISYRQIEIVVRNALRLSDDPAVALRAGQRMHVTTYGMYGYALLSSATHAEARDFAARYIRVHGPFCEIAISHDGMEVVYVLSPLHWPDPIQDVHRFAVEFALSAHLSTLRDLVGDAFKFSRVSVDYPEPLHAATYDTLFGCPILFGQRTNEYRHALAMADGPVALADSRTYAMAREMCEELLGEINRSGGISADIWRILVENPGRYPNIETIAAKMQMYPRALRRRLGAEGTTYRDLLAEVRMRLAIEYLRKTEMTNEEIASRLGYSDAANFRHAFLRWTGRSPSEFRGGARL